MTSIDWYFSTCADCGYDFESILEVSTNTFGLTEEDATHHIEKFERSYAESQADPFLCPCCGSVDITYTRGSKDPKRVNHHDVAKIFSPAISQWQYLLEQNTDRGESRIPKNQAELERRKLLVSQHCKKLAEATTDEELTALLTGLSDMARIWGIESRLFCMRIPNNKLSGETFLEMVWDLKRTWRVHVTSPEEFTAKQWWLYSLYGKKIHGDDWKWPWEWHGDLGDLRQAKMLFGEGFKYFFQRAALAVESDELIDALKIFLMVEEQDDLGTESQWSSLVGIFESIYPERHTEVMSWLEDRERRGSP